MSYRPLTFVVLIWPKHEKWEICIWVGNLTLNCVMETPKYGDYVYVNPSSFRTDNQKRMAGQGYCSKICTWHQLHIYFSGFQPVFLVPSTMWWRIILAAIICVWSQVRKKLQDWAACVWNASAVEEIMIWDQKGDFPIELEDLIGLFVSKSKIFPQNYLLIVALIVIGLSVLS